jgi:flagellar biosynthetic protein FliQ
MSTDFALVLINEMLWTGIIVSAPVLIFSMVVGLIISIFQVVTQIQEMSLTFVPKIFTVAFTIVLLGSWMLTTLIEFSKALISNIPVYF